MGATSNLFDAAVWLVLKRILLAGARVDWMLMEDDLTCDFYRSSSRRLAMLLLFIRS